MKADQEITNNLIYLYDKGEINHVLDRSLELIKIYPNDGIIHNLLGAIFSQFNIFEKSFFHLKKANKLDPNNHLILNNLANVYIEINENLKAIDTIFNALSIRPDFAEGYNTLGLALYKNGDIDGSIKKFKKAIELKNDLLSAYNNLGISYKDKNELELAFECFIKAIKINQSFIEPFHNIATIFKDINLKKNRTDLHEIILKLLERKNCVDPNEISNSIIKLLKLDTNFKNIIENYFLIKNKKPIKELISIFASYPLFLKTISVSLICDLRIERILLDIRSEILLSIFETKSSPTLLSFQSSLALHCFTNEYIYSTTLDEKQALEKLETEIDKQFSMSKQPDSHLLLCIASYRPLHEYNWFSMIINNSVLEEVVFRQIEEYYLEDKIEIKKNSYKPSDNISKKVKQQYEENPYPRWINSHFRLFPITIADFVSEIQIKIHNPAISKINELEILIAGCGTGQQSINAALLYKNSNVLAIDLSISSLKYAKRKTEELGLKNIEYLEYDILDLKNLNRKFDVIECVGVLHHMSDPFQGWSILKDCLKDGGLINIGLYSKYARRKINTLRKEIKRKKIKYNCTDIKSYRSLLIRDLPEKIACISHIQDFYNTSMFVDLLFHQYEKQFSLIEIKNYIQKLGLVFCGFEDKRIKDLFQTQNKSKQDLYDLEKWNLFEIKNPDIFAGMYQFWCQKGKNSSHI
tara:strand:+ start:2067 stop:4154 length:2088 start_codon:yes stop_codon:yes gene_type:complete